MRRLAPLSSDLCATFFHFLYLLSPYTLDIGISTLGLFGSGNLLPSRIPVGLGPRFCPGPGSPRLQKRLIWMEGDRESPVELDFDGALRESCLPHCLPSYPSPEQSYSIPNISTLKSASCSAMDLRQEATLSSRALDLNSISSSTPLNQRSIWRSF